MRLGLGILFFYNGFVKLLDPAWTAGGYLMAAKQMRWFYLWLARPEILPAVDFLNEWGLTLIGLALILGIFTRVASFFGIVLMMLYYIPAFPPLHGWVDEHVIYSAAFLALMAFGAGEILTFNTWVQTRLHPAWHKYFK